MKALKMFQIDPAGFVFAVLYYIPEIANNMRRGRNEYRANISVVNAFGVIAECIGIILLVRRGQGEALFGFRSALQAALFVILNVVLCGAHLFFWHKADPGDEPKDVYRVQLFPAAALVANGAVMLDPLIAVCGAVYLGARALGVHDTLIRLAKEQEEKDRERMGYYSPYSGSRE